MNADGFMKADVNMPKEIIIFLPCNPKYY